MNKKIFGSVVFAAAIATGGIAYADPVITVHPWLAPNVYGSPSWTGAVSNAEQGMLAGASSYGTPTDPTYYKEQTTPVSSAEVIVTGFPSWHGQVDPGTVFGPQYANELGNRMTFGLLIDGNGSQFSISQLYFNATSSDPSNALAFGFAAGSYTYSNDYMGIQYGADGHLGGGDDTYITSGSSTQLVDGLVGRGSGNSFDAYCPACALAQQQDALNLSAAYPGTDFTFDGTYGLTGFLNSVASGHFDIKGVAAPEPASIALAIGGVMAMGAMRRKQKSLAA